MKIRHQGVLYVEGPAMVEKISGTLIVAGAEFERVLVPKNKGTAIRLPEESELNVELMPGGSIKGVDVSKPWPEARDEALERIADRKRILVVGPVDSGKSFFTVLASNVLNASRIVDTDLGQGVISPPCTLAAARRDSNIPFLSYLSPTYMYFVGATTPSKYTGVFLSAVKRVVDLTEGKTIIDTTGRVHGEGARLKIAKAEMLDVDGVVLIEKVNLDHIAKALEARGIEYVRIPPLEAITERSREERREIRSSLYAKRLMGGEFYSVSRDKVYGRPFYGEFEIPGDEGVIARRLGEEPVSIVSDETVEVEGKKILKDDLIGLVVGLESGGLARGIGFIHDVSKDGITIFTPVKEFDYVRVGIVKINPETFEEAGWLNV